MSAPYKNSIEYKEWKEKIKKSWFKKDNTVGKKNWFKEGHKIRNTGRTQFKKGFLNPNWKGGKTKEEGYWHIKLSTHPFAPKDGYIRQARLIAEKCLSRYLTPKERIHHIGKKDDDRPKKLYLFSSKSEHTAFHNLKNKPTLKSNLI